MPSDKRSSGHKSSDKNKGGSSSKSESSRKTSKHDSNSDWVCCHCQQTANSGVNLQCTEIRCQHIKCNHCSWHVSGAQNSEYAYSDANYHGSNRDYNASGSSGTYYDQYNNNSSGSNYTHGYTNDYSYYGSGRN